METGLDLGGRTFLVVEDEYFIADDVATELAAGGASVVGPAADVASALALIKASGSLDAAVLDVNLRGEMVFPVADALRAREVPFLFATGYDQTVIPERFADVTRCEKPLDARKIASALFA